MNPLMMLVIILEAIAGIGSCVYVIVSLFAKFGYKIYSFCKYHASLYY